MLKLYYMPGACSLADHIVLEWAGAEYELVEMDRSSIKSRDYLALNPSGSVPVLRHDDFVLSQNAAILFYLAELYPSAQLLGGETLRERAEVMKWVAFLNSDVHTAFHPLFVAKGAPGQDPAVVRAAAAARQRIGQQLTQLDQQLRGRDWLVGKRSIADPYLFVVFRWALKLDVEVEGLRSLASFARHMFTDAGVREALLIEEGIVV